jgi:hypothetical protein
MRLAELRRLKFRSSKARPGEKRPSPARHSWSAASIVKDVVSHTPTQADEILLFKPQRKCLLWVESIRQP